MASHRSPAAGDVSETSLTFSANIDMTVVAVSNPSLQKTTH